MKFSIVLCAIFMYCEAQVYYELVYDIYDVENLVQNPRLLQKYMNCFLNKGPCAPIGRQFKLLLPEVIQTACSLCSPSQKRFTRKTFEAFEKYLQNDYSELKNKLDPQKKYFENFRRAIWMN